MFSQNEKGASFNMNGKKGYSMEDDFVNCQKVVIFDETEGMKSLLCIMKTQCHK